MVHAYVHKVVDASILKQYIFQKGFITEAAKLRREQEAQSATLQVCFVDFTEECGLGWQQTNPLIGSP